MQIPKFKKGDRVITTHGENGLNSTYEDGVEFVITDVRFSPHWDGVYYTGDPQDIGVWESRLERVPTEFAPEAKAEVAESTRTDLYYQPFPGAEWVSIQADQANGLRAKGYPVRKVTTESTTTVEYLP